MTYQPSPASPYGQPPAYGQPMPPPPPPGTNGFAIAALCVSFLSLCGALLGTIFGLIALSQIRKSGQNGKGLAIAGLIISGLWFVGVGGVVLLAVVQGGTERDGNGVTREGNVSANSLKAGDCIKSIKDATTVYSLPAVPCTQAHAAEVIGDFTLTGGSYPGDSAIENQAADKCETMLNAYAPNAVDDVENLYYVYPRSSDWTRGDRKVTCIAMHAAGRTTSLRG